MANPLPCDGPFHGDDPVLATHMLQVVGNPIGEFVCPICLAVGSLEIMKNIYGQDDTYAMLGVTAVTDTAPDVPAPTVPEPEPDPTEHTPDEEPDESEPVNATEPDASSDYDIGPHDDSDALEHALSATAD